MHRHVPLSTQNIRAFSHTGNTERSTRPTPRQEITANKPQPPFSKTTRSHSMCNRVVGRPPNCPQPCAKTSLFRFHGRFDGDVGGGRRGGLVTRVIIRRNTSRGLRCKTCAWKHQLQKQSFLEGIEEERWLGREALPIDRKVWPTQAPSRSRSSPHAPKLAQHRHTAHQALQSAPHNRSSRVTRARFISTSATSQDGEQQHQVYDTRRAARHLYH
jgi:hypothetical protein